MHRTEKEETTTPRAGNKSAQQRRFNRFRTQYNEERPHEALGQEVPASRWRPSPRPFPERIRGPEYPDRYHVRWISEAGHFTFQRQPIFVSLSFAGKQIGLEEIGDGVWSVYERAAQFYT